MNSDESKKQGDVGLVDLRESGTSIPVGDTATKPPNVLLVHGVLFFVQFCFGVNTVIGKLGLSHKTNPIFLALLREAISGPILFAFAVYFERQFIKKNMTDWLLFLGAGFTLFVNQLCYIIGLKYADSTTATVWQLTQPIFTILLTLVLRMEKVTLFNICGVLLSIGGAIFMIMYGKHLTSNGAAGHICFFINCLATSLYVIVSKPLMRVRGYKPTTVIGLAYIFAALVMFITNMIVDWWPLALKKICPDCNGNAFSFSNKAVGALVSAVILGSTLSYSLMTWANKWIYATIVSAYLVVQPLTAIILAVILNQIGVSGMDKPGLNDLGAIPIVAGLALIVGGNVYNDKKKKRLEEEAKAAQSGEVASPYAGTDLKEGPYKS